ncbi:MAG TPA: complex I NDUFA9 subunit family protein [Gaiellaceae bacterium]|nr:complex I NDUFA9 subunit family protein [Gaiellaceae bacterium]
MKILVTGGTGFVGSRIVHALRAEGRDVRALVRRRESAAHLASLGVELVTGDVTDPASLAAAADGCTHVVHLVAILKGKPHDFERVMTRGTQNVIAAAKGAGSERFVLMSALGTTVTTKDVVPYFGAKFAMEQDTIMSGLEYTIFRPSFVFGRGGALATFMKQVKYSPIVTVIGSGKQRVQPIWIDDVAEHFARALDTPAAANKTFEIGGPDIVTWDELYRTIAKVLGKRRALAHIPASLARSGALATQWIPKAPLSADQVAMIEAGDNVVTNTDAVHTFQLPLVPLEDQIRRAV